MCQKAGCENYLGQLSGTSRLHQEPRLPCFLSSPLGGDIVDTCDTPRTLFRRFPTCHDLRRLFLYFSYSPVIEEVEFVVELKLESEFRLRFSSTNPDRSKLCRYVPNVAWWPRIRDSSKLDRTGIVVVLHFLRGSGRSFVLLLLRAEMSASCSAAAAVMVIVGAELR